MRPLEIITRYYDPSTKAFRILREHGELVADRSLKAADRVGHLHPDLDFIREATMLHDIAIFQTDSPKIDCHGAEPYVRHGVLNECIKEFPKNVNVSVAMSLAAGKDTDVELWVDPAVDRNVHELFIEGSFGDTYIKVTNIPSPDNPSTSYLAALSILSLLNNLSDPIIIGT